MVPFCYSFGNTSLTEIDLITSSTWSGGAQSGNWYVGIVGEIDQFSMELSEPLSIGVEYTLSFYDASWENKCSTPIDIGLSTNDNSFGTLIYSSSDTPSVGEWHPRIFTFTAPNNGEYISVRGQNSMCWSKVDNFCIDTSCLVEIPVVEILMPNVFTPNGDNINDIFKPILFEGVKQSKLTIFNRWGQILFETEDITTSGWDGSHNSNQCTDGVYFWMLQYIDIFDTPKTEHGFFTLVR